MTEREQTEGHTENCHWHAQMTVIEELDLQSATLTEWGLLDAEPQGGWDTEACAKWEAARDKLAAVWLSDGTVTCRCE